MTEETTELERWRDILDRLTQRLNLLDRTERGERTSEMIDRLGSVLGRDFTLAERLRLEDFFEALWADMDEEATDFADRCADVADIRMAQESEPVAA